MEEIWSCVGSDPAAGYNECLRSETRVETRDLSPETREFPGEPGPSVCVRPNVPVNVFCFGSLQVCHCTGKSFCHCDGVKGQKVRRSPSNLHVL